jgi:CBS domain-containing protein
MIRSFAFDKNDKFPRTLDLKANGVRMFVDAARILALANGIDETSTPERLRAAARLNKIGSDDVEAIIEAFFFVQRLRLRAQQEGTPMGLANRVDPAKLNELDRLVLKEAFKQVKKLQGRLRIDYRL